MKSAKVIISKPDILKVGIPYTQLLKMGIMQGGAYFPLGNPKDNYFGVKASLTSWPQAWLLTDKMGWIQWWENYGLGRRIPEDVTQIARWQSFGRRHLYGLFSACKRDNTTIDNGKHWLKCKQALLHWGILATDANTHRAFCADLIEKESKTTIDSILGNN